MIYVHIPFCKSFCTYCGFYSIIPGKCASRRYGQYAKRVGREARLRDPEIRATLGVNTLYIGGGTPSVLPLSALSTILQALPYGPYEEFTLEANPEDVCLGGPEYLRGLASLGVNRLSMGFQSFDEGILRWMGRRHSAAQSAEAFSLAREAGFGNISIDLIFGISSLSPSLWDETLEKALEMRPEHISAYQLSIEEGSTLERMCGRGQYEPLPEEQCRAQYDRLCEVLSGAGYHHYEVSNFALPGYEAVHNSAYWRRVPYVGLGAAAHSFDGRRRRWNSSDDSGYISECEVITPEDERVETIMLSLRMDRGIEASYIEGPAALRLEEEGALVRTGGRLRIPEDRMFVSDEIIRELI